MNDSASGNEIDAIVSDLETVVERLEEVALGELRAAVARGDSSRPELERRVSRARNSLVRAIAILRPRAAGLDD